jgi:hypothetical protein
MHFGYVHNLCATSFSKIIQTNSLLCFISQFLDLTIFAKYCKNENKKHDNNINN